MRTRVRGWRWRHNPLRRRSDVVEAWTVLAVVVLLLVGAPLVGAVAAWWSHDEARATAEAQRDGRRQVRAEVLEKTTEAFPPVPGGQQQATRATVRSTEPGDGPRTATARIPADARTGETVDVWLDSQGRSVAPPPGRLAVWQHTITIGACAAGGAAAVILLGHSAVRHTATRHRLAEREGEWARTEPEWTGRRA
ncbi:Rv1733c family protein [Streptomyces dysideae]|uniref:Proline rich protein membrane protein n=1 Tax=Streptomyces dysideae TaxID=909626 RepID=A0A117RZ94_9ACTN|nr:hypothetical protein [Streptomyces dysideae]KUO17796.1 hypothetical protein AQJ91_29295 [Streptomyces dysideae]